MDPLPASYEGMTPDPENDDFVLVRFSVAPDEDDLVLRLPRREVGRIMDDALKNVPVMGTAG